MPKEDLVFDLGPSQTRFVQSRANIVQLVGPMGEGKTYAGIAGMINHAKRCDMKLHAAWIRDTLENIKTSTVQSINEVLGDWAVIKDNCKKLIIQTNPPVECDMFGIDDPASISKLQGPLYGCITLEEPAPIHERANAGLPKEVFLMAIARAGRQKGSFPRLQVIHNPADDTHWTSELIDDPHEYMVAEDGTIIYKDTFQIHKGENTHLTAIQRAMNQAAFKDDKGKWARYVEGEVATVQEGKRVVPPYNPVIHLSQRILPVYPEVEAFRAWDGYGHPCCGIAQYNPLGQLVVHDVLYAEGIGVEELIEEQLLPLLAQPKYKGKILSWRDMGDPSMMTADQSSTKRSAAKVIRDTLKTRFEPGPTRWLNRIEPTTHHLKRLVGDGRPAIILSASAKLLHRALKGGWHWKTDNSGNVIGTTPVKNEHSHPGDMFLYMISVLMPHDARAKKRLPPQTAMDRILSYSSGGRSGRPRVPVMMGRY
ncbi:MAG: hypothetical protein NT047_00765 [Deltaproteobacteria bacterium]|nr:hypothetical protein [Deltaproteobacteria bacterium]